MAFHLTPVGVAADVFDTTTPCDDGLPLTVPDVRGDDVIGDNTDAESCEGCGMQCNDVRHRFQWPDGVEPPERSGSRGGFTRPPQRTGMSCPECGGEELVFPVPERLAEYLPDDRPFAALCTDCLHVAPADEGPAALPDFEGALEALPSDKEAGAAVACLLAVLDSLVLYRQEADALATVAETRGADVMLILDRLAHESGIDPWFDLERRAGQLEQLI